MKINGVLSRILMVTASLAVANVHAQESFVEQYDNVLGSTMEIVIYGGDDSSRQQAASAARSEVARLEQVVSTWREDSEIMELNRDRTTSDASDSLLDVVAACEDWFDISNGRFSCRMGRVINFWIDAEERQERPVVPNVLPLARAARSNDAVEINSGARSITLADSVDLAPSGLAKGYIIDQAMAALLRELPDAVAVKLDIGGDASYWGIPPEEDSSWQVKVLDPNSVSETDNNLTILALNGMSLATSNPDSSTWKINDLSYSQIIDTRRGWPMDDGLFSVVIAPDAITADAVATTLSTMIAVDAIQLVNSINNVEALVMDSSGNQTFSRNWQNFLSDDLYPRAESIIDFSLQYELPDLRSESDDRPDVSIWVSDSEGRPVKNLLVIMQSRENRPNFIWWDQVVRSPNAPISNVMRTSIDPGTYTLEWDGKNDEGFTMPAGDYLLHLEASRLRGGHHYMNGAFTVREGNHVVEIEGEKELGDAQLTLNVTPIEIE